MIVLFFLAVALTIVVMAVVAAYVFRDQARPSKHQVARTFDPDACARRISEALPDAARAGLGQAGTAALVGFVLDYMKLAGSVANGDGSDDGPERTVILGGPASIQYMVGRARAAGIELDARSAQTALEAAVGYLAEIGAVGPRPEGLEA